MCIRDSVLIDQAQLFLRHFFYILLRLDIDAVLLQLLRPLLLQSNLLRQRLFLELVLQIPLL